MRSLGDQVHVMLGFSTFIRGKVFQQPSDGCEFTYHSICRRGIYKIFMSTASNTNFDVDR